MGRCSSLHEDFVRVKTPMGLERFEVTFSLHSLPLFFSLPGRKGVDTRGNRPHSKLLINIDNIKLARDP